MKSIIEILGLIAACFTCALVFCGLQCVILSTSIYDSIVGAKS